MTRTAPYTVWPEERLRRFFDKAIQIHNWAETFEWKPTPWTACIGGDIWGFMFE